MAAAPTDPARARTVPVLRVMHVPAKYIFMAFTKPEHLLRWYGPAGYPVTMCESDFRVGGKWRMAMTGPHGVQGVPFGGTYLKITPNAGITYDNAFDNGKGGAMDL